MSRQNTGHKSARAFGNWARDKAIESWPTIFTAATGAVMTYLAFISDWLKPFGPIAWGAVGLLAAFFVVILYWLYASARMKLAAATFTSLKAEAGKINTLDPIHRYERINLSDLYHPFFQTIKNARFDSCDFFGPGMVFHQGCAFSHCLFSRCEVVIVRDDIPVIGVTAAFENCAFLNSKLFQVTLVMNRATWDEFPEAIRDSIPIISEVSLQSPPKGSSPGGTGVARSGKVVVSNEPNGGDAPTAEPKS
jgi:hypothetical protein